MRLLVAAIVLLSAHAAQAQPRLQPEPTARPPITAQPDGDFEHWGNKPPKGTLTKAGCRYGGQCAEKSGSGRPPNVPKEDKKK
jgi:hypothetical protein